MTTIEPATTNVQPSSRKATHMRSASVAPVAARTCSNTPAPTASVSSATYATVTDTIKPTATTAAKMAPQIIVAVISGERSTVRTGANMATVDAPATSVSTKAAPIPPPAPGHARNATTASVSSATYATVTDTDKPTATTAAKIAPQIIVAVISGERSTVRIGANMATVDAPATSVSTMAAPIPPPAPGHAKNATTAVPIATMEPSSNCFQPKRSFGRQTPKLGANKAMHTGSSAANTAATAFACNPLGEPGTRALRSGSATRIMPSNGYLVSQSRERSTISGAASASASPPASRPAATRAGPRACCRPQRTHA